MTKLNTSNENRVRATDDQKAQIESAYHRALADATLDVLRGNPLIDMRDLMTSSLYVLTLFYTRAMIASGVPEEKIPTMLEELISDMGKEDLFTMKPHGTVQ